MDTFIKEHKFPIIEYMIIKSDVDLHSINKIVQSV
jgi:hypothetical protein